MVGTLIMDVYDGKNKNQVWHALANGTVEKNPKNRPRSTPGKIATIMNEFPVRPEM